MTINNNANAHTAHNAAVNAGLKRLPALPGGARKAKALRSCECGCEGLTGNRFVPGHDARLAGWVKRVERGVLVQGGDLTAQIGWIEENASKGEAEAVKRVLTATYGAAIWEPEVADEATGTDGK